ncbi:MAG TPA: cysteine--tRNA ligase [Candidatus Limnocylindrales bacterium]|nr:cysteine--tRNA ligase [Candidatus Limnocylindrales bacterium]
MTLRLFNVLGREMQEFVPLVPGQVTMYVCGPTVYDHPHIGHAKTYVAFDTLVRFLRSTGLDVLYVQNITDVGHLLDSGEDRILRKAAQTQARPMQIVETYTKSYFDAMDALGVGRPSISPRASGHIPEQIKMITTLLDKGNAYESNGSVYFDVSTDPDYGKLSNRRLQEQEAGTREAVRGEKRNPEDFALWKRSDPEHILRWESPWGEGFPGWHIECSAMAKKYLGETFDIHGGGIDNIFPHNESEVAQSECANDAPFARYWLLVGSLTVDGIKMSKSLGNFTTISDALQRYQPGVIRMFMQSVHYSNPVDYSEGALDAAARGWERMANAVRLVRQMMQAAPDSDEGLAIVERLDTARAAFKASLEDNLNTPGAIATLQDLTRDVNTLLNSGAAVGRAALEAIDATYRATAGDVLGILPQDEAGGSVQREAALIDLLVHLRMQARKSKNWAESDRLRDELAKIGVVLEDRADGTVWKVNG